jgi:hypothetical protein
MVKCGACGGPFLDLAGNERSAEDIAHCCLFCKAPVHSWVQEGCSLWMPVEGYYFCGQVCLQMSNDAVQIPIYSDECYTLSISLFSQEGKPKLRFSTKL